MLTRRDAFPAGPLSSEYDNYKTVKAISWPWFSEKGSVRAEGAQGTNTQSHISPNILQYTKIKPFELLHLLLEEGAVGAGLAELDRSIYSTNLYQMLFYND